MLKRNTYNDFGQFIAALKAAERLNLRYRVERTEYRGKTKPFKRIGGLIFGIPTMERDENAPDQEWHEVEYVLEILPDLDAASDATEATA